MRRKSYAIAAVVLVVGGVATASRATAGDRSTRAVLTTATGLKIGRVDFKTDDGHTEVRVRLTATPGVDAFHGFHIHANDVSTNGDGCIADPAAAPSTWFVSADGHYNPTAQTHSHHTGDMPVVYVNADGSVETRFRIDRIAPRDLNGKVVILHAGADNYANIPLGTGATQYSANSPDASAPAMDTSPASTVAAQISASFRAPPVP